MPCSAGETSGQLSVLAQILAPYAGGQARAIARRLITRFGSIYGVYSASPKALADEIAPFEDGRNLLAGAIVAARRIAALAARECLVGESTTAGSPALRNYLVHKLGMQRNECVIVVFFTGDGLFIAEDFYKGAQRNVCVLPLRRTVSRAFDLDARRVVLAHNHPSGEAQPSQGDIRATRHFENVLDSLEFVLDDHFIVARSKIVSMRELGVI